MSRRTATQAEKEIHDKTRLRRAWRKFHREERDAVLTGPYARTLTELFRMFANLKHVTPAQLVGFIGAIDWGAIDYQTRLTVLHEVNSAITKFREQRGLEPISDPLPGQPDNAYRIIKNLLNSFPQSRESPSEHSDKQ